MARHRSKPILVSTRPQPTTIGLADPGKILLHSADGQIQVQATLRGPVQDPWTRPKIITTERAGRSSVTDYVGREPYETIIPITFDQWADNGNVEDQITALDDLARKHGNASEPPTVRVDGPVPDRVRHQEWRIADLRPVDGRRTEYTVDATRRRDLGRSRITVDVYLIERVTAEILALPGQGIHVHTTKTLKGEKLRDVAHRIYKDRSMARQIAAINFKAPGIPWKLGEILPTNLVLKLPY